MTPGPGTPFALPGPEPFPVRIRLEAPGDEAGVRRVNLSAFSGPEEADLVDRIRREAPDGWHSLVAVGAPDGPAEGIVVGHLLLSPCPVDDAGGAVVATVLAIGPLAVLPELQFRGIGSTLMAAAVGLAMARGAPALVLLGQPAYYPRFGFESARGIGLLPPAEAWPDAAWMARRLPAWTESMRGTVRYPAAFEPLA